jgi:hypothetical protein
MGERRIFCGNNSIIVTDFFYTNNEKKIGRQYQKRRKNMRTSGLFYFSSNDRFKKEPINFINLRNLVANKLLVQKNPKMISN